MGFAYSKKHGVISIYKETGKYRDQAKKIIEAQFTVKLDREASLFFCEIPEYLGKFNPYVESDPTKYTKAFGVYGDKPPRNELNKYVFDPTYKGLVEKVLKVFDKSMKVDAVRKRMIFIRYEGATTGQFSDDKTVSLSFDYFLGWRYTYTDGNVEYWLPSNYNKSKWNKCLLREIRGDYRIIDWSKEREATLKTIKEGFKNLITRLNAFFNKLKKDEFEKAIDRGVGQRLLEAPKEGSDNVKTK